MTTGTTTTTNGAVLYHGPSMLDGAPIVAIVTGIARPSTNAKTGPMLQTWILRADTSPTSAVRTGLDASVCGSCPHRGEQEDGRGRSCYVDHGKAPANIYRTWLNGGYTDLTNNARAIRRLGYARRVRLGAYGDPAAVPAHIWHWLLDGADGHTGYTHQTLAMEYGETAHTRDEVKVLRDMLMASADTLTHAGALQAHGWRTFRVMSADEQKATDEIMCPAALPGSTVTCSQCLACDGAGRKKHIALHVHGTKGKVAAFNRNRKLSAL